jgi:hypothetical protein
LISLNEKREERIRKANTCPNGRPAATKADSRDLLNFVAQLISSSNAGYERKDRNLRELKISIFVYRITRLPRQARLRCRAQLAIYQCEKGPKKQAAYTKGGYARIRKCSARTCRSWEVLHRLLKERVSKASSVSRRWRTCRSAEPSSARAVGVCR